jgi:hypothetical protein
MLDHSIYNCCCWVLLLKFGWRFWIEYISPLKKTLKHQTHKYLSASGQDRTGQDRFKNMNIVGKLCNWFDFIFPGLLTEIHTILLLTTNILCIHHELQLIEYRPCVFFFCVTPIQDLSRCVFSSPSTSSMSMWWTYCGRKDSRRYLPCAPMHWKIFCHSMPLVKRKC